MDRPGLLDFHTAAEDGDVAMLLVHSLTRLGRDIGRRPMLFTAFIAKTSGHHDVSNGQQHTDKITSKVKGNQHTGGK